MADENIEYGCIRLKFNPVKPEEIINAALYPLTSQIKDKQIELHINIENTLPLISVDLEKIILVMVSLIGNAIRYTPRWGSIFIRVNKIQNDVRFSVHDTGKGLKPETIEKVFDSIVNINAGLISPGPGLGLALTIAREIVLAHNGKIWAESELGKGCNFFFSIPLKNGAP